MLRKVVLILKEDWRLLVDGRPETQESLVLVWTLLCDFRHYLTSLGLSMYIHKIGSLNSSKITYEKARVIEI